MKRLLLGLIIAGIISIIAVSINLVNSLSVKPAVQAAELSAARQHAVANGTFIQWWLVQNWDDKRWTEEFETLKEAGMFYVILAPTAFYKSDLSENTGITRTVYPTKLDGFDTLWKDNEGKSPDIVDACLRNAQKAGIKVFVGLNFSDEWWTRGRSAEWLNARMAEGNRLADELWDLYRARYPDAFYGWYWCWEVDNGKYRTFDFLNSKDVLTNAIKMQLDHFEKTGKRLPFMLAPFMDWKLGTPEGYAKLWEYVFINSGMKEGDVFCPQDCIGAGGLNMSNYMKWFSELRKAVDKKPGLLFWGNVETFNGKDWTGATLDRFVKQMNDLKPYVDDIVTFSYSHYYSPNIIDTGFHSTYLDYAREGRLEAVSPTTPSGIEAEFITRGSVLLNWNASLDNIGVCGYYVFRNGKLVANFQVKRGKDTESGDSADIRMTDSGLKPSEVYVYEVQAYDFAGNSSSKSAPLSVYVR